MAEVPVTRTRRALLSVTDKRGLADVAEVLRAFDYELIASGGTAGHLRDKGFTVTEVSELTGYPEIFGGRVKTLHPAIHGGILGKQIDDFSEVQKLGIAPIDLVLVNLYRFEEAAAQQRDDSAVIEAIDIGGPGLLRAAAKNFDRVTVVPDPDWYGELIGELQAHGGETSREFRQKMAGLTFSRVARYNTAIADWFGASDDTATISLRYGENPHLAARLELPPAAEGADELSPLGLALHGGKPLSYNNLVDLVAAVKLVCDFADPCCGVIKHTNPCGFGLGASAVALEQALVCDPVSAFGGVFAFNAEVDLAAAEVLNKRFLEIIAAPSFGDGVLDKLKKKKNVRILSFDRERFLDTTWGKTRSFGKLVLRQDEDQGFPELAEWNVAAGSEPDAATRTALEMAWKVCKHGKSNAIVIAGPTATLGVGFGQMSRVDSVRIAVTKAGDQGLDLTGSVAASDGFFPFPDGVEQLAAAGVKAVIAPGGSIRDEEVAAAARELGVTLVFSNRRHFNH